MAQALKHGSIIYWIVNRRFSDLQQELTRILQPLPQVQVIIDRRGRERRPECGPMGTDRWKGNDLPQTHLPDHAIDRMVLTLLCQIDWGTPLPEALESRVLRYFPVGPTEEMVAWWEGVDGKKVRINHLPLISLKRTG